MKVSIVIPVFNEANTVIDLLTRVFEQPVPSPFKKEIIVVESNSTDGTRQKVQAFISSTLSDRQNQKWIFEEATLVLQEFPQGKGSAVQEGFCAATGDVILIQDGDLEYDVADYPALLEPFLSDQADLVLGSRHLSSTTWKIRKFEKDRCRAYLLNVGSVFFHGLFNLVYKTKLTDPTTMFKVFLRSLIANMNFTSNRFDFDFELLGKLIRVGARVIEIPVTYTSRGFSDGKKIRIFRDPPLWLWAIFKHRFSKLHRTVSPLAIAENSH